MIEDLDFNRMESFLVEIPGGYPSGHMLTFSVGEVSDANIFSYRWQRERHSAENAMIIIREYKLRAEWLHRMGWFKPIYRNAHG